MERYTKIFIDVFYLLVYILILKCFVRMEFAKLYTLPVHVPTCFVYLRAHVPPCPACVLGQLAKYLAYSPTESICSFFFQVKLFFCDVLYWDEKTLWNKVETRRVTWSALSPDLSRAFRHKWSSKILISQMHLGFLVNFTGNWHSIDMDSMKHIKSRFWQK